MARGEGRGTSLAGGRRKKERKKERCGSDERREELTRELWMPLRNGGRKESRPLHDSSYFPTLSTFPERETTLEPLLPIVPHLDPAGTELKKIFAWYLPTDFIQNCKYFMGGRGNYGSWIDRIFYLSFFFFLGEREREREGRGILPWSRWCQVVRLFEYDIRRKLWDFVRKRRRRGVNNLKKVHVFINCVMRKNL